MTVKICESCSIWQVVETDRFCSWCGREFRRFQLFAEPRFFPPGDPRVVTIRIENLSPSILHVTASSESDWVETPSGAVSIAIGATIAFEIDVDPPEEGGAAKLIVQTNQGDETIEIVASDLQAEIAFAPPPTVYGVEGTQEIPVSIRAESGRGLLRSVSIQPSCWLIQISNELPGDISSAAMIEGVAILNRDKILTRDQDMAVTITADFEPCAPVITHYQIRHESRIPEVAMDFDDVVALADEPIMLQGRLYSTGSEKVTVMTAEVQGESRPFRVTQADDCVRIEVDLPGRADKAMVPLLLKTTLGDWSTEVKIVIKELEDDRDGALAIDFGTSNTCCAILEQNRAPQVVAIRDSNLRASHVLPTSIIYFNEVAGTREYRFGKGWIEGFGQKIQRSLVREMKRRLENTDPLDTEYYEDPRRSVPGLLARDAATALMSQIRYQIERQTASRYLKITATHPAVFGIRQTISLRNAIRQAFPYHELRLRFVQEPVAAAITTVFEHHLYDTQKPILLAVYDFGGGTTDISIIRITTEQRGPIRVIKPVVLKSFGMWFGGEDLTRYLAALIRSQIEDRLDGRKVISGGGGQGFREAARENHGALWLSAETQKLAWADNINSAAAPIALKVTPPGALKTIELISHIPDSATLRQQFEQHIKDKVTEFANRLNEAMSDILEAQPLEYLVLSGMSSLYGLVQSTLETALGSNTKILTPQDRKQCVVQGACYFSARRGRVVIEVDQSDDGILETTTSAIGPVAPEGIRHTFEPVIPFGEPIPKDGLVRSIDMEWPDDESSLAIHENLGFDHVWEGPLPHEVPLLGRYVPEQRVSAGPVKLVLTLTTDLALKVQIETLGGSLVDMRQIRGKGATAR